MLLQINYITFQTLINLVLRTKCVHPIMGI